MCYTIMKLVEVVKSHKRDKKLTAVFDLGAGKRKTISFGAKGYKDFTMYHAKDPELAREKRAAYIARHSATESWRSPATPATLARYILWEKPTVAASVRAFKKRFGV